MDLTETVTDYSFGEVDAVGTGGLASIETETFSSAAATSRWGVLSGHFAGYSTTLFNSNGHVAFAANHGLDPADAAPFSASNPYVDLQNNKAYFRLADRTFEATVAGTVDLFLKTQADSPAFAGAFTEAGFGIGDAPLSLAALNTPGTVSSLADATINIFEFGGPTLPTPAVWTGGGVGDSYNDPANWDINRVPINNVTERFAVSIPSGDVAFDVPGAGNEIDELVVNGTLTASNATSLTVLNQFTGTGTLNSNGSVIQINGAADADESSMNVTFGGTIAFGGTMPAFRHLANRPDYGGYNVLTETLLSARDAGSVLDLSTVETFDVGYTGYAEQWRSRVYAEGGGTVDLSNVTTITAPIESDDFLEFYVNTGGTLDLSSLQIISSASAGRTFFYIEDTSQSMPALTSANLVTFDVGAGGHTLNLPLLTTVDNLTVSLDAGATFDAPVINRIEGTQISMKDGAVFDTP